MNHPSLPPELVERVLARLGFTQRPEPTLENLRRLYAAWCQRIPFDNVRKLIHIASGSTAPFPGTTAEDFFEAWLRHGTGGTCWAGAGALHALLLSLGFEAERGFGTMMAAPNLPPNHGTVRVLFGGEKYLTDCSILHMEPLHLDGRPEAQISHPAWGLRASRRDRKWHIAWRPLHKLDGLECRLEGFGLRAEDYQERYEKTRAWSPFNYEVCARLNKNDHVVGIGFGKSVVLQADGIAQSQPVTDAERRQLLIEEIGLSEEIVSQLPADSPTPPPPGSKTAAQASAQ
jgi:N-hydroxyarylamine O-acetyltransferase